MKYAWIAKHAQVWPVVKMCRMLDVSPSGFKAWRGGGRRCSKRLSDAQLLLLIRAIHAELNGAYGSRACMRSCASAASVWARRVWSA